MFEAQQDDVANVEVLDLTGRVLYTRTAAVASGENTLEVTLDGVATGLYLLRVRHNGETATTKMIVE